MKHSEIRKEIYLYNCVKFGGNRSFADLYRLTQNREAWRATAVQLNELPSIDDDDVKYSSC